MTNLLTMSEKELEARIVADIIAELKRLQRLEMPSRVLDCSRLTPTREP